MNLKKEKNLNEGIDDLLNFDSKSNIPDIDTILKSRDKKTSSKKKSLFTKEELEAQLDSVVVPKSLKQLEIQKQKETDLKIQKLKELVVTQKQRATQQDKSYSLQPKELEQLNIVVKQEIEELSGKTLPDNFNYVKLEEEVQDALNNIPGTENINIGLVDLNFTKDESLPESKEKRVYYKTKVSIKKDNIPDQINVISSLVKSGSNGLIFPRVCDLRVIGNTNKTQLRNSPLKLSLATVVFKPDFTKLKVNKGTRIMLSIPDNYSTTGNLLVFIQESRDKKIIEIVASDFGSQKDFDKYISDIIINYYNSGFSVTSKKLELRSPNNTLMQVIDLVIKTKQYKVKPYTDSEGHLFSADFFTKDSNENQWLYIQLLESSDFVGMFEIWAKNLADQSWEKKLSLKPVTIKQLLNGFVQTLTECFEKDWSNELGINSEEDSFYYLYSKLQHNKLKQALIELNDLKQSIPGLKIAKTLSKIDTAKSINPEYDAEAVIGKTPVLDYFILSFLAYQVSTSRKSSEYITKPEYTEKYGIKNPGESHSDRKRLKTINSETGEQRGYFGREYMFQLEYSLNGQKHIYRNLRFEDVKNETQFLSENPLTPISKY